MTHKHRYLFDTMQALAEVHSLPFACAANAQHGFQRNLASHEYWFCQDRAVNSWDDIRTHLEAPLFQPGVDRISKLAADISAPTPKSRRRKPVQAEQGDELDIHRVWQGDLEHAWRTTRREQSIGPSRVLILINAIASYGTTAQETALRGAAALALADTLISAGYTVQISAAVDVQLRNYNADRYSAEVVLLPAGGALDLHKLASLVASGLLLRGVLLDHMQRVSTSRVDSGTSNVQGLREDTVDTTGWDYVATVENHELRYESDAQEWLAKHVGALDSR